MELILVRHAQPLRIETGEGPADPPLSPLGRSQAEATARWLSGEKIDLVVASPLLRALETAAPIAEAYGVEATIEPEIAEFDRDSPIYIPLEELKRTNDPRWQAMAQDRWHELVDVDPSEFQSRVVGAIERLAFSNPGRRVVVVCHGGIINVYAGHILGLERYLWFEPAYASITRVLAARNGIRTVLSLNETGHLRSLEDPHPTV